MNIVSNGLRLLSARVCKRSILITANRFASDGSGAPATSKLRRLLENVPKEKINDRDSRGWTALMLAAREGDTDAIELLVEKGSEPDLRTSSGHTAYDIAVYWRNEASAKLLKPAFIPEIKDNFFSFDGMQRNSQRREHADWVKETIIKDTSNFIMMHRAKPLVGFDGDNISPRARFSARPSLLYKSYPEIHQLIDDSFSNVIYLGDWSREGGMDHRHGSRHVDKSIFAVDVSQHEEGYLIKSVFDGSEVLSPFPGMLRLSNEDAGVLAQARSILDWQRRYKFCPTCGSATKLTNSGYKMTCSNNSCSSHKGDSNISYPRVDPTIISALISRDDEYCLLGRQKSFPQGMYSCLAGFIEPGESIEQACRREIFEEVGIYVTKVDYHSSQPWPMPSTLMIGCTTRADHDRDIKLDTGELEDARWFPRQEIVLMLMDLHPEAFFLPPRKAIATRIINDWLVNSAFN